MQLPVSSHWSLSCFRDESEIPQEDGARDKVGGDGQLEDEGVTSSYIPASPSIPTPPSDDTGGEDSSEGASSSNPNPDDSDEEEELDSHDPIELPDISSRAAKIQLAAETLCGLANFLAPWALSTPARELTVLASAACSVALIKVSLFASQGHCYSSRTKPFFWPKC